MSIETTEVQPGTETPETIIAPVPDPAPVEMRYEYQPTDEQGRPLGAKQVIKYRTIEEFQEKFAEQNTLLIRKLREETRKNRLGQFDPDAIPDDAPKYEEPLTFQPRPLSPEERVRISRDLLDPERFDEAADALLEARMGARPERFGRKLADLEADVLRFRAKAECEAFVAENPKYVKCQENFEAITNWMMRYGLAPVKANFQRAYDKLRTDKVLIETYEDVPEPTPIALVPEPTPVVEEIPPTPEPIPEPTPIIPPARIPTGLNRNTSDEVGAPRSVADDIVYEIVVNGHKRRFTGLAAINAMPSEEYKHRVMSDPTFAKKEAQLEREAAERRRAQIR